ncbi:MAG: MgtC/SapB family protein [Kiritimatiellae bacterium]|jgi:putative Mg2+ transporter-C (MgtC) family protein|nr:MgtC/SapB family protein [Kiritimatiellia bacterium]
MASCGFMLVGLVEYGSGEAQARLAYGIITGIGFIGGGAILKRDGGDVSGVATAASIWCPGAIGMAVAHRRFVRGMALALINFLTFWLGRWVKSKVPHDGEEGAKKK